MLWLDAGVIDFSGRLPPWLVAMFDEITDFGRSSWILVPSGGLILLLAALASPALDRMSQAVAAMLVIRLGYVFVAIGLPGLVVTIVKRWIGRIRPSDSGPFAFEPFSWRPDYASLPSGHTATAFGALVAIGAIWPRARPALWAYAFTIALSRLVVTAHYPSDVIVGAAYGAFGAIVVREWFAARSLGFYIGSDGRVHARPGPSFARVRRLARAIFAR
jgi:undecaprenyl-diphosphatase